MTLISFSRAARSLLSRLGKRPLSIGLIETIAGLLVIARPLIGGYVVAAWLPGIIVNLLLPGSHYDVAIRDFGLMPDAPAPGKLARAYNRNATESLTG